MEIKEFIVVEGKDDTTAIKRAVHADTIETNGSAISEEVLRRIQHAQEKGELSSLRIRIIQGDVFGQLLNKECQM